MYVHKHCPAQGARRDDGKSDGIYLHGEINASFNGDGRRFFADMEYNSGAFIHSIECLDCEGTISTFVEPVALPQMEEFLARGDFDTKIGWLD